ncbi:MAG: hypothetical protein A2W37_08055 [Chloroflexi bacterium RBG_16_63_12]|nr:MAG: hypothetical protein A2W37_08055 [Chloroflexi bacterium RBG_16_63_12]
MNKGLMEDEIDLREYVNVLLRHWKMIVVLTMVAAVAVGVVSFIMPPTYEATALISVAQARYTLRLEGVSDGGPLPLKAYPDLAVSDEVVSEVFNQVKPALPSEVDTLTKFRKQLKATAAADPTLLRLAARDTDPARAAQIANAWANTLADRAGRLYGQDAANLLTYETQLTTTKSALEDSEQALATFQANNQVAILTAQLNSQQAILTDYLNRVHQFGLLVQDAQDLRARLAKLDPSAPPSFTDDVVMLMLSAQAFGGQMAPLQSQPSTVESQPSLPSQSSIPLQVQISSGQSLSGKSVAEQAAVVDDLLNTLRARAEDAKAQIAALEPRILELQGRLAKAQKQQAELTRARDLAQTQYLALASKVEEAKIAAQESANVVQLASEAAVPTERANPRIALNIAVAGALGLMVSVFAIFVWEWWRGAESKAAPIAFPAADHGLPIMTGEYPGESAKQVAEPGLSGHSG